MENKVRLKMDISERAKQFMPFMAVTGLDKALKKKELEIEEKFKTKNDEVQEEC